MRFKDYKDNVLTAFLILLQRTDIQKTNSRVVKKIISLTRNKFSFMIAMLKSVRFEKVFKAYESEITHESNLLHKLIIEEFPYGDLHILDIGAGVGGYHRKWISETHYNCNLYLMDNSEFNFRALAYGHGESDRYYNSLSLAKKFLSHLENAKVVISTIEIKKEYPRELPDSLDLIISFISWGFHYPLEEYWSAMIKKMRSRSSLILVDLRKLSTSYSFLLGQTEFSFQILSSNQKYDRVLIRKRGD